MAPTTPSSSAGSGTRSSRPSSSSTPTVVGLMEIENGRRRRADADLVSGLNDATAPGTYDYVATGRRRHRRHPGRGDLQAGIGDPGRRPSRSSTRAVDPKFIDDKNRPVVAQSVRGERNRRRVTVAVNHLKSKGSDCNDVGDPDLGDGQANCNGTRTWLLRRWSTGWQPIRPAPANPVPDHRRPQLVCAGRPDRDDRKRWLHRPHPAIPGCATTRSCSSAEAGYLDHAMSSTTLYRPKVTGAAFWHINADETGEPRLQPPRPRPTVPTRQPAD